MRGNPKVCVEVDEIVGQHNWRTVLVFGRYEEIDDSAAGRVLRTMIQPKLEAQPGWWFPGAAKLAGGPEHHVAVLYRVRIDSTLRTARGSPRWHLRHQAAAGRRPSGNDLRPSVIFVSYSPSTRASAGAGMIRTVTLSHQASATVSAPLPGPA